jgi:hypothetical protein
MFGSKHRHAMRAHTARVPRTSSASTSCTSVHVVSHSCSPAVSTVSLARRITGTGAPLWWLVHRREKRDRGHQLASNRCFGVCPIFAMLVGQLSALIRPLVGQRGHAALAGGRSRAGVRRGIEDCLVEKVA